MLQILKRDTPAPPSAYGLREAVERLEQFVPPAKSAELVAAEAKLREVRAARRAVQDAITAKAADISAAQAEGRFGGAPVAELTELQRLVPEHDAAVTAARAEVEAAAAGWRRQYQRALADEMLHVRRGLHALLGDLDSALQALSHLGRKAADQKVGATWLARVADDPLLLIQRLRGFLDLDRRVAP